MKMPVDAMIAYASSVTTLYLGDVLATGSPPGVGAIRPGDELDARISGIGSLHLGVAGEARGS